MKKFQIESRISNIDKNTLTRRIIIIRERAEISAIFNETANIYYIPHMNINGQTENAAGKFCNAFNNVKKTMRTNGMLLGMKQVSISDP